MFKKIVAATGSAAIAGLILVSASTSVAASAAEVEVEGPFNFTTQAVTAGDWTE